MPEITLASQIAAVRSEARPLTGAAEDFDSLLDSIGEARVVLIGEASHGTHEFYETRAEITKRLIVEKGFGAVAVEADWPDAYRVNRYVRGSDDDTTAVDALADFQRFPSWMWRNADVLDFIGWLREHNDERGDEADKAEFYGLDLYSMFTSVNAVINYLEKVDPEAAIRARSRYECFEQFNEDTEAYGYAAVFGRHEPCEDEVIRQLLELQQHASEYAQRERAGEAADEFFFAEQNARVVKNAEEYYRTMFYGGAESWNLRDRHMFDTLQALIDHIGRHYHSSKVVVWAHNSHLGDARATQMSRIGELNIGQLVKERYGDDAFSVGFTTYSGTVTAVSSWGGEAERKVVRPALQGSYEQLFHRAGIPAFLLIIRDSGDLARQLEEPRLERAIGVIYRPETERASHYFYASLSRQFDAVMHYDETRAVEPLERTSLWETGEAPATFPFAV